MGRSRTAQYVAWARVALTDKGVIDDPYARSMLTPGMRVVARVPFPDSSAFLAALAARIVWFDRQVVAAIDDGIEQVVILGAGYDSRAWRFARPGVTFVEVDHPVTQADKRRRAPAGGPTYVAADLIADDVMAALGPLDRPVLFVIEGVTMYLRRDEVAALLRSLTAAPPGSRLAVNVAAPPGTGGRWDRFRQDAIRRVGAAGGEPHRSFFLHAEAGPFVAATGWNVTASRRLVDVGPELLALSPLTLDGINDEATVVAASIP